MVLGRKVTDDVAGVSKRRKLLLRISQDPLEEHNLVGEHPDVVKRMFEEVKAFRALEPAQGVAPFNATASLVPAGGYSSSARR